MTISFSVYRADFLSGVAFIRKTVYRLSFIVYREDRFIMYPILSCVYPILSCVYPIVRVSYPIVYYVKVNVAGAVPTRSSKLTSSVMCVQPSTGFHSCPLKL